MTATTPPGRGWPDPSARCATPAASLLVTAPPRAAICSRRRASAPHPSAGCSPHIFPPGVGRPGSASFVHFRVSSLWNPCCEAAEPGLPRAPGHRARMCGTRWRPRGRGGQFGAHATPQGSSRRSQAARLRTSRLRTVPADPRRPPARRAGHVHPPRRRARTSGSSASWGLEFAGGGSRPAQLEGSSPRGLGAA